MVKIKAKRIHDANPAAMGSAAAKADDVLMQLVEALAISVGKKKAIEIVKKQASYLK